LENLPDSICNLENLRKFDIYSNRFTKLPDCIVQLSQLIKLDITGNNLSLTLHQKKWLEEMRAKNPLIKVENGE